MILFPWVSRPCLVFKPLPLCSVILPIIFCSLVVFSSEGCTEMAWLLQDLGDSQEHSGENYHKNASHLNPVSLIPSHLCQGHVGWLKLMPRCLPLLRFPSLLCLLLTWALIKIPRIPWSLASMLPLLKSLSGAHETSAYSVSSLWAPRVHSTCSVFLSWC